MSPPRGMGRLAAGSFGLVGLVSLAADPVAAADVFAGQTIYTAHCANCHGADGTPLLPGTPNFARGEGLMAPDIVLVPSLKDGKGLMPGFNHILSEKDILDVLVYTRSLQR